MSPNKNCNMNQIDFMEYNMSVSFIAQYINDWQGKFISALFAMDFRFSQNIYPTRYTVFLLQTKSKTKSDFFLISLNIFNMTIMFQCMLALE